MHNLINHNKCWHDYIYLQTGDEKEVMYFRADSDKERKEWIQALRIGCLLLLLFFFVCNDCRDIISDNNYYFFSYNYQSEHNA